MLSVILPILTGIVITTMNTFKPIEKWAICAVSAKIIESEIYKFRTRTGIYKVSRKKGSLKDKGKNASKLFSEEMGKIWKTIESSEMKLGALKLNGNEKQIISEISAREKKAWKRNANNNNINVKKQLKKKRKRCKCFWWCFKKENIYNFSDKELNEDYNIDIIVDKQNANKEEFNPCEKMTVEKYVATRLQLLLSKYQKQSYWLESTVFYLQVILFLTTASGAIFAFLGQVAWVPVLMAFVATLTTYMDNKQFKLRLISANSAQMHLEQLQCYWQGLSVIERRKYNNASYLVENTEATVTSEFSVYVQAVKTARKRSDEENEDIKEEDKKIK